MPSTLEARGEAFMGLNSIQDNGLEQLQWKVEGMGSHSAHRV